MGDPEYEKSYLKEKKRRREMYRRLIDTKRNQEIYHKIMGSHESEKSSGTSEDFDDLNIESEK